SANIFDYSSRFSTAASQKYNFDTNGQNVTFATALTSSGGALIKLGVGNLSLSGTNTYSGTNTVTGGTLPIGGSTRYNSLGALTAGTASGNNAVLNYASSGTSTFNGTFNVGGTNAAGAVNQSSGTISTLNNSAYVTVGNGGYGSYVLSGGTLS